VTRSLVAATSSSRFVEPNYWRDPASGNAFQIQVEIPQNRMTSVDDVRNIPVMPNGGTRPLLGDVADVKLGKTAGEIDRYNMQRVVSFTANVEGVPLGEASKAIRAAVQRAGTPPRGVTVNLRGQIPPLEETLSGLRLGLALSIGAIFLLLAAAFQSFRLALGIVLMLPAVLVGVALALLLTHTTLNVQSFTGAIMAMGIAVANAILLVSFAERTRVATGNAVEAAATGARDRLRAVLMTATAMIAGMIPIALGAEQTAPLGRAVIGGLIAATFATLLILPGLYAILQSRAGAGTASLDPTDPESRWYEVG
jgi:multidrug efflux pump subunit AcrB